MIFCSSPPHANQFDERALFDGLACAPWRDKQERGARTHEMCMQIGFKVVRWTVMGGGGETGVGQVDKIELEGDS